MSNIKPILRAIFSLKREAIIARVRQGIIYGGIISCIFSMQNIALSNQIYDLNRYNDGRKLSNAEKIVQFGADTVVISASVTAISTAVFAIPHILLVPIIISRMK